MDVKTLHYFLAIARNENMTAAARELFVTQSALSRQLQDLEQELGKKLFIREHRKMVLTKDGYHLKQRAEEIISLMEKTQKELREDDESLSGDINIGAGESAAMSIIAETIKRVQLQHPQIHFHIRTGTGDWVSDQLEAGILDFGVVFEPFDLIKFAYIPFPTADQLGLLIRSDHPLAKAEYITRNDLENLPLIVSERYYYGENYRHWLGIPNEKMNVVATYNLSYNASLLVRTGVGCAISIISLFKYRTEHGLVFIPFKPAVKMRLQFAWKKGRNFSRAEEYFLKELQQYMNTIQESQT